MLRRLQIRASQLSEKELRRAALWSAALQVVIFAITSPISYITFHSNAGERPVWLDVYIFVVSLPLAPGFLVGGGIGDLIRHLSGYYGSIVNWIEEAVGIAVNWYLYFLIFSLWISWCNKRKQQRAAAQGA
jgi:hypothetical protein